MRFLNICLLSILFLFSCKSDPNKELDQGEIKNGYYHSEEIGWTIEIPKGWIVTKRNELEAQTKKGLDAVVETTGVEHDISELKQLINFHKDEFHSFQSSAEPFNEEVDGSWHENNLLLNELVYQTLSNYGIPIDTSYSKAQIDQVDFELLHITLYDQEGEVILYQDIYGSFINGYDVGINLNYVNDKEKDELMTVLNHSTFK